MSLYLSYMMFNLGGVFPLGEGDGCAQLDPMDLEGKKISAHVACSMEKGQSPKMT